MSWQVELKRSAEKELEKLQTQDQERILEKLFSLKEKPFPDGAIKLKGHPGYRLRVGDYRILYEMDTKSRVITVSAIGHRKEVYR